MPDYKYDLKDLFDNTPKFDGPPINYSGNSSQPKELGKLYNTLSKIVLSPKNRKTEHFWNTIRKPEVEDFRYKLGNNFPMQYQTVKLKDYIKMNRHGVRNYKKDSCDLRFKSFGKDGDRADIYSRRKKVNSNHVEELGLSTLFHSPAKTRSERRFVMKDRKFN